MGRTAPRSISNADMTARTLRPGGQIEVVEIDWQPRCDKPPPANSYLERWFKEVQRASTDTGKPIAIAIDMIKSCLEYVGFTVTSDRRDRLDTNEDCRVEDTELHNRIASLHRLLHVEPEFGHYEALSMRLLTKGPNALTAEAVRALCKKARAEVNFGHFRLYHVL